MDGSMDEKDGWMGAYMLVVCCLLSTLAGKQAGYLAS